MTNPEKKTERRWLVEMTEDQAREIYAALEFKTRIRMGQFDDLRRLLTPTFSASGEIDRTYKVMEALFAAVKAVAFPDLHRDASWGVAHTPSMERLWDMYVTMRNTIARKTAESMVDDDPTSKFLVARDDPAHRVTSDWPMLKMTFVGDSDAAQ